MKKLFLILLLVLALCACGKTEVLPEVSPESESSSSGEELEASASPNSDFKTPEEMMMEHIAEDAIDFNTGVNHLSDYAIFAEFENIVLEDDWYYTADLVLQKGLDKIIIPVKGVYYHSTVFDSRNAPYGGFSFLSNGKIVFCGMEKAVLIDPKEFKIIDISFELPKAKSGDLWINGASFDENSGNFYLIAAEFEKMQTEEKEGNILCFDPEGKFLSEKGKTSGFSIGFDKYVFPYFMRESEITEQNGKTYINNYGAGYAINVDSGEQIRYGTEETVSSGEYKLDLIWYYTEGEDYESRKNVAMLYKNEKIIHKLYYSEPNFSDTDNMEESVPELEVAEGGKKAVYRDDYFAMTLTFDFEKGSHKLEYNPTDEHTEGHMIPINSADGKFSLCGFGSHGGGDIAIFHVSLRNNETGKHTYIGESGGMYGGYNGMGFLKNNDVYFYSTDKLWIFDSETGEKKFDLGEKLRLGYNEETESERGILTFRRDPEDFSYIIVYYEYENGFEWKEVPDEEFGWHEEGSCNYKIGFLDPEGNLTESYDTGCPIIGDNFGLCKVDMKYSERELTVLVTGNKGGNLLTGVFDMETKEFTVLKPED